MAGCGSFRPLSCRSAYAKKPPVRSWREKQPCGNRAHRGRGSDPNAAETPLPAAYIALDMVVFSIMSFDMVSLPMSCAIAPASLAGISPSLAKA